MIEKIKKEEENLMLAYMFNIIISIICIIIIGSISHLLNDLKVSNNLFVLFKKLITISNKRAA